jgi:orotate phosphoribosyltransferase
MEGDLAERLIERSELHGDFVLSSGKRSDTYFDKFLFLSDPALLRELASEVVRLIPVEVTHIAAPEGAATLLLAAVGLETGLPMAVVRKAPKKYGTRSQVEGNVGSGARVALLEDVSTTGNQTKRAAGALEDLGCRIELIVLAIDRGGGGSLRDAGYRVEAIAEPGGSS